MRHLYLQRTRYGILLAQKALWDFVFLKLKSSYYVKSEMNITSKEISVGISNKLFFNHSLGVGKN